MVMDFGKVSRAISCDFLDEMAGLERDALALDAAGKGEDLLDDVGAALGGVLDGVGQVAARPRGPVRGGSRRT